MANISLLAAFTHRVQIKDKRYYYYYYYRMTGILVSKQMHVVGFQVKINGFNLPSLISDFFVSDILYNHRDI